ncbi:MAG: serine hydrolase, partial [Caulobacteraceae bacterium]
VRDLLVHWSGLGAGEGDLLWSPDTTRTRAEIVRRLRYLKPAGGFRQGFAYDNVLYMAAGQIIEAVTGQTWEAFTAEHLLTPAGMAHSTSDEPRRLAVADQAWPHARAGGAVRGAGPQRVYPEGFKQPLPILPAGGLAISANDMARWLAIQLAHGALARGGRLFSEAQSKEMWRPVVAQAVGETPPGFEATRPQFAAYALGWEVQDYKGVKIVWHPGATAGYRAAVVLVPGRNVGFSIFVNAEEDGVVLGLTHELLDHYLGDPPAHWPERYAALVKERTGQALAASKAIEAKRVRVGPSAPLARYAGDYVDAWYGPISIRLENGRLVLDFRQTPGMVGELDHFQYDTFRTRWRDHGLDPAYVTFALGAEGKVDRVTLKPASPGDFSFDYQDLLFTPVNR